MLLQKVMKFKGQNHRDFFFDTMKKCRRDDGYHRALVYLLGLTPETRNHFEELFDIADDTIVPEGLKTPWQTSGTSRICRMAFNLWNDYTDDEPELYTPSNLFCCEFAPYFVESLYLRYPEYMRDIYGE